MRRFIDIAVCMTAMLFACALGARAADAPASSDPPVPTTPTAATHHRMMLDGREVRYTATAGRITLRSKSGDPIVSMFAVAYALDGTQHATRPVTFVWNGGPGSSTLWLHMGAFAPVRVATNDTGAIVPPAHLVPNDGTLLAASDLVFIDAPGTGYSRLVGKGKKDDFYGIDQDARTFTQFIEAWLSAFDRWGSPKFLIGESYGTTRAANVVNRLQRDGVGVNGVVLISSALDLTALDPALPGDDRSNLAFLPSEAAVAWYHDALPAPRPPLATLLADVRTYAAGPYAAALLRGDKIDAATLHQVANELHRFTGLSTAYIERANLRIDPSRFEKELERESGKITGRLDGRFEGDEVDRNADVPSYDPTLDAVIQDAFVSEFNRYVRDDLHFRDEAPYAATNYDEIGPAWKIARDTTDSDVTNVLPNVLPDLQSALTHNPSLRVFSGNGWFDLATPFFGTEIALGHLALPARLQSHVTFGYYASGHMIYLNPAARGQLKSDIEAFMRAATAP